MPNFIAKRVRFRNGERHSVLSRLGGLPVHETTLYLAGFPDSGTGRQHHPCCLYGPGYAVSLVGYLANRIASSTTKGAVLDHA